MRKRITTDFLLGKAPFFTNGLQVFLAVIPLLTTVCLLSASPSLQAQNQRDILTEQQTDELRDAAFDPDKRIELYLGYIEDRTQQIHTLSAFPNRSNTSATLHKLYQEFTELTDELQDNLDSYEEQHADMRKALKEAVDKSQKWPEVLKQPRPSSDYEFVQKTALEASQSVTDSATQMLSDETKYFAAQKEEKKKKKE